jgi:hypothetical protein
MPSPSLEALEAFTATAKRRTYVGDGDCAYHDTSAGDATWFQGREWIDRAGRIVYELHYHGGLIRD